MNSLRLGYVLQDGTIKYDDSWNDKEIAELLEADKYINKVYMFVMRIYILTTIKEDIEEILKNLDKQSGSMDNLLRMERLIREYFVETGMFLSHWKKLFTDNNLENVFAQITHTFYDANDYYKMLDILRNFVEHVGYLVSVINFDNPNNAFILRRDKILEGRNLSGNKKKFAEQLPDEINLVDVINGSFNALSKVEDKFMIVILSLFDYMPYCDCFDKYLQKMQENDCDYCLVECDGEEKRYINILNNGSVIALIRNYYSIIFLQKRNMEACK